MMTDRLGCKTLTLVAVLTALVALCSLSAQAQARSVPLNRGVVTTDTAPTGSCTAAESKIQAVFDTDGDGSEEDWSLYRCADTDGDGTDNNWQRDDIPSCGGAAPSGACSANAACQDSGSLYLCNAGTWGAVSGGGGSSAGSAGAVQSSDGASGFSDSGITATSGNLGATQLTVTPSNEESTTTYILSDGNYMNFRVDADDDSIGSTGFNPWWGASSGAGNLIARFCEYPASSIPVGRFPVWDTTELASGCAEWVAMSGDVALSGTGATTIQADSVALTTDTTGDYVQSLSTGGDVSVSGGTGEGSTPTISVVGLGGGEVTIVEAGLRGTSTDDDGDGSDDNPQFEGVRVDAPAGPGASDTRAAVLYPSGIYPISGKPISTRSCIIVDGGDYHMDTAAKLDDRVSNWNADHMLGDIPITFSDTKEAAASTDILNSLTALMADGHDITGHTADHECVGWPMNSISEFIDYPVSGSAQYCLEDDGTVSTNGTTTVTGSGTGWSASSGATDGAFTPLQACMAIDVDGTPDGLQEDERQNSYRIVSVDSSTQITLDRAVPETTSGAGYEIFSCWGNALYELDGFEQAVRDHIAGADYNMYYHHDPGAVGQSDFVTTLAKAQHGLESAGSMMDADAGNANGGQELTSIGRPAARPYISWAHPEQYVRMPWFGPRCYWDSTTVDTMLDACTAQGGIILLNSEDLTDSECSSSPDQIGWTDAAHTAMLNGVKSRQANGEDIHFLQGRQFGAYLRNVGLGQPHTNLILNSNFYGCNNCGADRDGTEFDNQANAYGVMGWWEDDYDTSLAGVQPDSSCDLSFTGDGDGKLTISNSGTLCAGTNRTTHDLVLSPGTWTFMTEVDNTQGSGSSIRIEFIDTDNEDTDDGMGVLDPIMVVYPTDTDGDGTAGGVTHAYFRDVPAGAREIIAFHFNVPDGFNQNSIRFRPNVFANFTGTAYIYAPTLIREQETFDTSGEAMHGSGIKHLLSSRHHPDATGGQWTFGMGWIWNQPGEQSTWNDTPTNDVWGVGVVNSDGTKRQLLTLDQTSASEATLEVIGDITIDGTSVQSNLGGGGAKGELVLALANQAASNTQTMEKIIQSGVVADYHYIGESGTIDSIACQANADPSAGQVDVYPRIVNAGGTTAANVTSCTVTIDNTYNDSAYRTRIVDDTCTTNNTWTAGQLVTAVSATDGSWSPTTNDIICTISFTRTD